MKKKILFLTSHPMSVVVFMLPHLIALHELYDLKVLANTEQFDLLKKKGLDVEIQNAPVERRIVIWKDFRALFWLILKLLAERPNAIHTITPKAGLIGMMAAFLVRVPVRVHTFTGQVWVTRKGPMRWLLKVADRIIALLATDVLVDSPSQHDFLVKQGVVKSKNSTVLGAGSICGVNIQRFRPNFQTRRAVRIEMGTSENSIVCLYLGRLNRDKGVLDLAKSFAVVATKHPSVELWVVGPDEDDMFSQMQAIMGNAITKVRRVGYTNEPERFMQAADLFCLPSYREGFGSSVIEAAACGVPALVSRIYGLTDAVEENITGWMHSPADVIDLVQKLDMLMENPKILKLAGSAAKDNAEKLYDQRFITNAMLNFYDTHI